MSNTPKPTIQDFYFNLSRTCTNNSYDLVYEFYWFPLKILISLNEQNNILSSQTGAFKSNCRFKFDFIGLC